jgi:ABC-2 type transport system permease protein
MTLPLTTTQIVLSKFIAIVLVVAALLLSGSFFPLLLCIYGNPEIAPVFSGLFGVFLLAMSYVAVGLAVSSWTSSSLLAGVTSTIVNLLLYVIHTPSENNSGVFYDLLRSLSLRLRMTEMIGGMVSTASVSLFFVFIVFFLFISNAGLQALRSR